MNFHAVYHQPVGSYAFGASPHQLRLRLRTARDDCPRVFLVIGSKYHWEGRGRCAMEKVATDRLFDYWQCNHTAADPRFAYYFELEDHRGATHLYAEDGFVPPFSEEDAYLHFFQYPFLNPADLHTIPGWMADAVFYQIFVDRFHNGDPANDPPGTGPWADAPDVWCTRGGDLAGIIQKLDYLARLGVNALYLTPIFASPTNHKYDTTDYRAVDPAFGDLATLKLLVGQAHDRGIRVVLDAVFNHSGVGFAPFQDVLERGEASKYKDWFHIDSFPVARFRAEQYTDWRRHPHPSEVNYHTFGTGPNMPKLNTANPELRAYLYDTALYWMREAGIDGWRLDVADEIDHGFWRGFRQVVKAQNPEAVIIGESWHDSAPWLQGDQFDSVMNYGVTKCLTDFFATGATTAAQCAADLSAVLMRYTDGVNLAMLNLLDSHDTVRFLTRCGGHKARYRLAVMALFCLPGAPCTYYGDEIGTEGGYDPDCRRAFRWDEASWDKGIYNLYKRLIKLRRGEAALRQGSTRLGAEGGVLCIQRSFNGETIRCLINNTPQARHFVVSLPPYTGRIIKNTDSILEG